MTDLFATYGPDVVAWVMAALGSLLATYVWTLVRIKFVRDALQRAWTEVQGAVLEVSQTYSDSIKLARKDGTLSETEKLAAKKMAIDIAKANLGEKGLRRLGRVLGFDPQAWLASKTEQAVKIMKTAPGDAPLPTIVGPDTVPVPP